MYDEASSEETPLGYPLDDTLDKTWRSSTYDAIVLLITS